MDRVGPRSSSCTTSAASLIRRSQQRSTSRRAPCTSTCAARRPGCSSGSSRRAEADDVHRGFRTNGCAPARGDRRRGRGARRGRRHELARAHARELSRRRSDCRRRDGRGVQSATLRRAVRTSRCAQGAQQPTRFGRRAPQIPHRTADPRHVQSSAHRAAARWRHDRGGAAIPVMEYIEGLPIDAYCEQHQLSTAARLRLFVQVCAAVQVCAPAPHRAPGHQGIEHPGDGRRRAEAARLRHREAARGGSGRRATANLTMADARLLTPRNASPEQIRGATVTTAERHLQSRRAALSSCSRGVSPIRLPNLTPLQLERAICETDASSRRAGSGARSPAISTPSS